MDDNYYRGAQPDGSDYADLAAVGIKMLINLTSDDAQANEEAMAAAAGMKYVQLPMTTRVPPTPERVAEFLKIVTDPANQPVYVHCVGGRHRTGVMSAIYRMTHDGWTGEQAFKEMKQYKYGADFLHPEFKTFVLGFMNDAAHAASPAHRQARGGPELEPRRSADFTEPSRKRRSRDQEKLTSWSSDLLSPDLPFSPARPENP